MNRIGFIVASVLLVFGIGSSMLFVVDQRQFGVVYALGEIKSVITEPGSTSNCRRRSRTSAISTSVC
jgi:membrane protease subunit HflC